MSARTIVRSLIPVVVVLATAAGASAAVPDSWTPVKSDPTRDDQYASTLGGALAWSHDSAAHPGRFDMYVEKQNGTTVKVNAAGTQGIAGDLNGQSIFYLQQLGDRSARIQRYDLTSGKRSPLPAKVNQSSRFTINSAGPYGPDGNPLTASGPWLLFSALVPAPDPDDDYPSDAAMLYNRVTHRLVTLGTVSREASWITPGQVNGRYAVWVVRDDAAGTGGVYRYDLKTHTSEVIKPYDRYDGPDRLDASVSADGTVYYFERHCTDESQCSYDLVRAALDGTKTVLATVDEEEQSRVPGATYVKDRADGSHLVYITIRPDASSSRDIYRYVDDPSAEQ